LTLFTRSCVMSNPATSFFPATLNFGLKPTALYPPVAGLCRAFASSSRVISLDNPCAPAAPQLLLSQESRTNVYRLLVAGLLRPFKRTFARTPSFSNPSFGADPHSALPSRLRDASHISSNKQQKKKKKKPKKNSQLRILRCSGITCDSPKKHGRGTLLRGPRPFSL
jgi:hypothetical protein